MNKIILPFHVSLTVLNNVIERLDVEQQLCSIHWEVSQQSDGNMVEFSQASASHTMESELLQIAFEHIKLNSDFSGSGPTPLP